MERTFSQTYLQRHIALPADHGSWVFIISPLLIGLFAGRQFTLASVFLIIAAMAAFLIRQPVTIAIKAYSGRRSRRDLPAARFWMLIYAGVALAAITGLAWQGFAVLLILALPGVPVFVWHLVLVSQRAERRQMGIELVGSGVLALAAPAAYWVGVGQPDVLGWWLLALTWLQSAASIVYAYLRLEQRELKAFPTTLQQIKMSRRALLYTGFNFLLTLVLGLVGLLARWIFLPYALQFVEAIWGTLNPAIGAKPTEIGFRQLTISTLFTIVFILVWWVG
jgi:hypothetical protein